MSLIQIVATVAATLIGTVKAEIKIQILAPVANARIYDSVATVTALVASTFDVKKVAAVLAGKEYPLALSTQLNCSPGPCQTGFTGAVSMKDAPKGWNALVAQATDLFDSTGRASVDIYSGEKLRLEVSSPFQGAVAAPDLRFKAACFVDSQACHLTMKVTVAGKETSITPAGTSVDTVLDFREVGRTGLFEITACDKLGACLGVERVFWVESDTVLRKTGEVNGTIQDFTERHILYTAPGFGTSKALGTGDLKIRDRGDGGDISLEHPDLALPITRFHMTPNGGVFLIAYRGLYEWFAGAWTNLFPYVNGVIPFKYLWDEGYVVWQYQGEIVSRKAGGPNHSVKWPEGGKIMYIRPTGAFLYAEQNRILEFQGDTAVKTVFTAQNTDLRTALTDGSRFLYVKKIPEGDSVLVLSDGTTENILPIDPAATGNYRLNGGWIAYTAKGGLGQDNIRLRSPQGQDFPVTFFGASSNLESLASDGELTYVYGGLRYWMDSAGKSRAVSGSEGIASWRDSGWVFYLGPSMLKFHEPAPEPPVSNRISNATDIESLDLREIGGAPGSYRTFRVTGMGSLPVDVLLFDPGGRKRFGFSARAPGSANGTVFTIPAVDIPRGISFLRVRSGDKVKMKLLQGVFEG